MSQPLTASIDLAQLDKLETLARAATPGPWYYQEDSDAYTHIVRSTARPGAIIGHFGQDTSGVTEAIARFVAVANPATVQQLIALARRSLTSGPPAASPDAERLLQIAADLEDAHISAVLAGEDVDEETKNRDLNFIRDTIVAAKFVLRECAASHDAAAPSAADYEEVLAGHRRLVRELDVALNGEAGAAKQASLCDIVSQVKSEGIKSAGAAAKTEQASQCANCGRSPGERRDECEHCPATAAGAVSEPLRLLQAAAQAWNNENDPALDAAMEEIEVFLLDHRNGAAAGAGSAQPEALAYELSESELKRLHRVLALLGVAGVEELDTETSMACLWSLMQELIRKLDAAPAAQQAGAAAPSREDAIAKIKSFWRGYTWNGVTKQDAEDIDTAFAALARAPLPARDLALTNDGREPDWAAYAAAEQAQPVDDARDAAHPVQDGEKDAADLHDEIMRLPCNPPDGWGGIQQTGYKIGHRDARHAAAELAAAQQDAKGEQ